VQDGGSSFLDSAWVNIGEGLRGSPGAGWLRSGWKQGVLTGVRSRMGAGFLIDIAPIRTVYGFVDLLAI
jgi:hypothetical protein